MNHYTSATLTPPPAHLSGLGHTPPPPHIQVHSASGPAIHTPPPAHMNLSDHRSSPGLQLLGHVAASPQLRLHATPSPHMSAHSAAGSPAHHGLLTIDRPTSRESYSMTPPRAQVFPHAGIQPELIKVLRPSAPNTLTIPNGPGMPGYSGSSSPNSLGIGNTLQLQQALYQQHQQQQAAAAAAAQTSIANQLHQLQYLQAMQEHQHQQQQHQQQQHQQQQQAAADASHQNLLRTLSNQQNISVSVNSNPPTSQNNSDYHQHNHRPTELNPQSIATSVYNHYAHISAPEPSPHQELKMLANIASSELNMLNSQAGRERRESGCRSNYEQNNNRLNTEGPSIHSQRIQNLNNFPSTTPYASSYRSRSIAMQRARSVSITGAAKSLDILREVMQTRINTEIQSIVDGYIDTYFRPALDNIRDNNGQTTVGEEHIQCMCRKILEEASRMYMGSNGLRSRSVTPDIPDTLSEVGSVASERHSGSSKLPFARLKRKPQSDTESEGSTHKKRHRAKRGKHGSIGPSGLAKEVKRDGPRWDTARFSEETHFIMGSKANRAVGLGNTRGRIYLKHPELFKYSGDADDKLWLHENRKMPVTGGKAYMMILEDVKDLAATPEYRNSIEEVHLKGFTVPQWMILKIQKQMQAQKSSAAADGASSVPKPKPFANVNQQEQYDSDKNVPFKSAASSRKSLSDSKVGMPSPANTEEMELLSSEEQEEQPVSPFGSAEDYAPVSPSNHASSLKDGGPANLVMTLPDDRFGIA